MCMAVLLGGCVENTLIVKGNSRSTAWIAEKVVQAHAKVFCEGNSSYERRSVRTQKNNRNTDVEVQYTCGR